jgi:uncharacterized caspase-like protein
VIAVLRKLMVVLLGCLALAGQASSVGAGGAEAGTTHPHKIALVIGNSAYKDSPLGNPVNDASAMARTLKDLGFEVTALLNATLSQMNDGARQFGDRLGPGDVGLFYYAGHGMQIRGRNFLIPVDADIRREDEVQYRSFDANQLLDKMESARNPINIVILDACRNNPFTRSFRSASSGLAQMEAPVGSYISFATAPGKIASDGDGENGLFTQHLLKALATPKLKLEEVFKQVRLQVMRDSGGQQIPWDSSSLTGDFYFLPDNTPALAETPTGVDAEEEAAHMPAPVRNDAHEPALSARSASKEKKPAAASAASLTAGHDAALAEEAYHKGLDAQKRGDAKAALEQFEKAAEHGHGAAQYELAQLLKIGRPPARQDLPAARRWFGKAAEQGNTLAQYELGKAYIAGQGGEKNCQAAERWLRKAAGQAHVDAMLQLGWLFQRGCEGDRNPNEAAHWLKKAAAKGSRDAQFSLGVLYFNGEGIGKDPKEARKWLEAAAAQGHPSTRLYLDRLQ